MPSRVESPGDRSYNGAREDVPKENGVNMPVITVDGPRIDDLDRKRKLVRAFTDAASEAFGLGKEAIVVILHETSPDCVSTGGELVCDRGEAGPPSSA